MYNEVLEVIRTLYKVTREVQEEKLYVKVRDLGQIYDQLSGIKLESYDDGSCKFSFRIDKKLIMSSWIEYRPKTNRHGETLTNKKRNQNLSNSISGESEHTHSKHETDKVEMATALFEEEKRIVSKFLDKFVANPEISKDKKLIDISNLIKALTVKFNSRNVIKSEIINMRNMQLVLIGYQNTSQDKLFAYYGSRIKNRVFLLAQREVENREIIQDIKKYSNSILSHESRMNLNKLSSKKAIPFPNINSESDSN